MTNREFSDGFDTLLNSYANVPPFGEQKSRIDFSVDEYEKSMFLTDSQEELVTLLYTGASLDGKSFEETEQMRRMLDSLVKTETISTPYTSEGITKLDSSHTLFQLPENTMFVTTEQVKYVVSGDNCLNNKVVGVVPITQDEYNKIKNNPFRGANDNRVLRLDCGVVDNRSIVELVANHTIGSYIIRYLEKPTPIVLEDFTDDELSVNGVSEETPCKLNSLLHKTILERAVLMALKAKTINNTEK